MIRDPALSRLLAPLARTVETVLPEADLLERLATGRPLRCKFGIDPTSSSVHVGNAVQLWNLRRLQDLGHQAVLILGDTTATVGDPSGKDKTRPMLTPEAIEENLATWMEQLARVLDMERVEVRRNSEWFTKMSFHEVLDLADRMTVQQMMERDSFERRWQSGAPISLREFLYCLMQGWDSVAVRADIELGGTDQTFNLMVGRRLMEQEGLPPQVALIGPLLEGIDGHEKMSKSLGNAIGLDDDPKDQFGKAMRISDEALPTWLARATDLPDARIAELLALPNPMDAKLALGEALVARYHGAEAGREQREEFLRIFRSHEVPADLPESDVGPAGEGGWWIVDVLKACSFAGSTSEARRLVEGGGVRVDETVIGDWRARLQLDGGEVLRVGRRRQARLVVPGAGRPAKGAS
jgi:tyrosyl-tRNA synthetase